MDAQACDVYGWRLWFYVGCLMLMFGVAWLTVLRHGSSLRRALVGVAVFNLVMGVSLLLVGLRDSLPYWMGYTLVNPLQIVAYVVIWRAGQAMVGMPESTREQGLVLVLSGVLTLMFGFSKADEPWLLAVAYGGNAWVALRGPWLIARRLSASGARNFALVTRLCGLGIGLPMAARAIAGVWMGPGVDVDVELQASQRVAYVCLVVVFCVNVLMAHYVFGRAVLDAERLSSRDPLTGLDDRRTVEQALDYEWGQRRGRPLVLLTLAVDELSQLRSQWGVPTCDAVIAEVALLLRAHMRPGDVLGHAGNGTFLMLLPNTTMADAVRLSKRLLRSVAHDRSLHPDGGQALTLSAGLAVASDHAQPQAMVQRAETLCQRAQLAGGNRLDDRPAAATWVDADPPAALVN